MNNTPENTQEEKKKPIGIRYATIAYIYNPEELSLDPELHWAVTWWGDVAEQGGLRWGQETSYCSSVEDAAIHLSGMVKEEHGTNFIEMINKNKEEV